MSAQSIAEKSKKVLFAAALSGLAAGAAETVQPETAQAKQKEVEKCWGLNKCQKTAGCNVKEGHIKAANAAFKKAGKKLQFKMETHTCDKQNSCSHKKGLLNWIYTAKGHCHRTEGGFLISGSDSKGYTVDFADGAK